MSEQRDRLIDALKASSDRLIEGRADRILWVSANTNDVPPIITGRVEELALFNEAKKCFFGAHFIATIVVAAAYVEQQLVYELLDRGLTINDRLRVSEAIELARKHQVLDGALLDRIDAVAELRNSYAHYRDLTHPTSFSARFQKAKVHPDVIRENDAHEALRVMDEVFHATLS